MKFHEKLTALRKSRGYTQEQLAEKLGVSRQAVSRWESGDTTPEMGLLAELCRIFGVSADYLIYDHIQTEQDIPIVKEKEAQIQTARQKNKWVYLFSGSGFLIAAVCWGIALGIGTPNDAILAAGCFCCALNAALAAAQFINFFQTKREP